MTWVPIWVPKETVPGHVKVGWLDRSAAPNARASCRIYIDRHRRCGLSAYGNGLELEK
jgi:hypothetical protein